MQASDAHSIYFLGIGGIGMSALARYFKATGKEVHGYDLAATPLTQRLEKEGIAIHYDDDPRLIPEGVDCVIYTPAIPQDHSEMAYFRQRNTPLFKRAEVIGQLSREHPTIAVAGTHGKTSICALAAHLLKSAGLHLTAFVGGIMKNYDSNLLLSNHPEILLVEADEYDRSFLRISPDTAVVSAIDADHLDVYGDFEEMEKNYLQFAGKLREEGLLIAHSKLNLFDSFAGKKTTYGIAPGADISAQRIRIVSGRFHFDLTAGDLLVRDIRMQIPGRHYIENALAAAAISMVMGLDAGQIRYGLETFRGVERRFDLVLEEKHLTYVDDYAHHPEEITATISAVRELYPGRKLTGIFQPHLYSRTRDHADGFASSLEKLDEIILLDIYPAREKPLEGISSQIILDRIGNPNKQLLSKAGMLDFLERSQPEVVLSLGAGDIGLMTHQIESILRKK